MATGVGGATGVADMANGKRPRGSPEPTPLAKKLALSPSKRSFTTPTVDFVKPDKAYKNMTFLNSPGARSIRIMCEMKEAEDRLSALGVQNVVMVFGSARAMSQDDYDKKLSLLEAKGPSPELERLKKQHFLLKYHEEARKLGKDFSCWARKLHEGGGPMFVLGTGGGPGMMEACNHGARDADAPSLGFGISVPFEPGLNPYVTPELAFEYHYFFTRKFAMSLKCKGLVVAPGGWGTCDELFEFLTLMQTGKIRKMPIVLIGRDFWPKIINHQALCDFGMISQADVDSVHIVDSAEEVMAILSEQLPELGS